MQRDGRGRSSHRRLGAGVGRRRQRPRAARAALRRQHARRRRSRGVAGVDPQRRVAGGGRAGCRLLGCRSTPAAARSTSTGWSPPVSSWRGTSRGPPHVLYDYEFLAMEHWDNAVLGAAVAAHNMVCAEIDRWAHLLIPQFWSASSASTSNPLACPPLAMRSSLPRVRSRSAGSPPPTADGAGLLAQSPSTTPNGSTTTRQIRGRAVSTAVRRDSISRRTCAVMPADFPAPRRADRGPRRGVDRSRPRRTARRFRIRQR